MRILISNDDGYGAVGIEALAEQLEKKWEIYIIAPQEEKSGTSQAITVRTPLTMDWHAKNRVAINGFPADCINVGIVSPYFPDFDLVISGINHGPNMGTDVIFSGTVAAARQALMHGISGIAVSLDSRFGTPEDFQRGALHIVEFVEKIQHLDLHPPYLLNVNLPAQTKNIRGFRFTELGHREYIDEYVVLSRFARSGLPLKKNNKNSVAEDINYPREIILHGEVAHKEAKGRTDFVALEEGYISVTPLLINQTKFSVLERFADKSIYSDIKSHAP